MDWETILKYYLLFYFITIPLTIGAIIFIFRFITESLDYLFQYGRIQNLFRKSESISYKAYENAIVEVRNKRQLIGEDLLKEQVIKMLDYYYKIDDKSNYETYIKKYSNHVHHDIESAKAIIKMFEED